MKKAFVLKKKYIQTNTAIRVGNVNNGKIACKISTDIVPLQDQNSPISIIHNDSVVQNTFGVPHLQPAPLIDPIEFQLKCPGCDVLGFDNLVDDYDGITKEGISIPEPCPALLANPTILIFHFCCPRCGYHTDVRISRESGN